MIKRTVQNLICDKLFKKKLIVIYGARQVGKTTLLRQLQKSYPDISSLYLNCDEPDIRDALSNRTSTELNDFTGKNKLILIDEAERIENAGLALKLFVDNFPDKQIIATGSSAFELSDKIKEPLTGRKYEFNLYPFSFEELKADIGTLEVKRKLEQNILFGMYPDVDYGKIL